MNTPPINLSIETYERSKPWDDGIFGVTYANKVDDNLWMGACPPRIGPPDAFRSILDMYDWEPYKVSESTVRRSFRMNDGRDVPSDHVLFELADWVNERRKIGPVLVHCQAGINRSGLVTALALIRSGLDPENAIKQIRERRSKYALSNSFFADYLRRQGELDDIRDSDSTTAVR